MTQSSCERLIRIGPSLNILLGCGAIALGLFQYFYLPLYLLRDNGWWALSLFPVVLLTTPLWSLIHETFHGAYHPDRRVNNAFGRLLSVVFGSPFRILRFGHLTHHRFNRSIVDRTEIFDPATDRRGRFTLIYYLRLCVGLYMVEVASVLMFLMPYPVLKRVTERLLGDPEKVVQDIRRRAQAQLLSRRGLRELRVDSIGIILLFALSFASYGTLWWVLLLSLAGRGFIISIMDNAYHYGTPIDKPHRSHNLKTSRWMSLLMLNFNLHGTHHRHPGLPWYMLPRAFKDDGDDYDGYLIDTSLKQFRGPIAANGVALNEAK